MENPIRVAGQTVGVCCLNASAATGRVRLSIQFLTAVILPGHIRLIDSHRPRALSAIESVTGSSLNVVGLMACLPNPEFEAPICAP